jgi:hypothetical protein
MKENTTTRMVLVEKAPFYIYIPTVCDYDEKLLAMNCDSWEAFEIGCRIANVKPTSEDRYNHPKHFYVVISGYLSGFIFPKSNCEKI